MTDFDNLRGQWENTLRIERGYTFVDTAPLECHIGYDDKLRRTLLIISRHEVKIPPPRRDLKSCCSKRATSRAKSEASNAHALRSVAAITF